MIAVLTHTDSLGFMLNKAGLSPFIEQKNSRYKVI